MYWTREQQSCFKENRNRKNIYNQYQKETADIIRAHDEERGFRNLLLIGHFESKRDSEKQRITVLTCLHKYLFEQGS